MAYALTPFAWAMQATPEIHQEADGPLREGGADPNIVPADIEAFRRALDAAGVQNELVIYESAPHSFFDRTFAAHEHACRDAWARVPGFIDAHL
jgi:carboxymethylenebutenolidase